MYNAVENGLDLEWVQLAEHGGHAVSCSDKALATLQRSTLAMKNLVLGWKHAVRSIVVAPFILSSPKASIGQLIQEPSSLIAGGVRFEHI
jgi:hypothetical protein